jgi:hypothetical protein
MTVSWRVEPWASDNRAVSARLGKSRVSRGLLADLVRARLPAPVRVAGKQKLRVTPVTAILRCHLPSSGAAELLAAVEFRSGGGVHLFQADPAIRQIRSGISGC